MQNRRSAKVGLDDSLHPWLHMGYFNAAGNFPPRPGTFRVTEAGRYAGAVRYRSSSVSRLMARRRLAGAEAWPVGHG